VSLGEAIGTLGAEALIDELGAAGFLRRDFSVSVAKSATHLSVRDDRACAACLPGACRPADRAHPGWVKSGHSRVRDAEEG